MVKSSNDEGQVLKQTRIIIVLGNFTFGGAERQALLLARHFAQDGAHVEVWGTGQPGPLNQLCDRYGIPWRDAPIPLPWSSNRLTQLKRLLKFAVTLRRAKPDVILPFMFLQSVACGIVWRFTGARVCIWNQRSAAHDRRGRWAESLAIRATPSFVANSQHGADFLVKELGIDQASVHVINNGVELASPAWNRSQWRQHLGVSEDSFLACMVANLQSFKDHVTLLKAWRIVVDRLSAVDREAVLLLAGAFHGTDVSLKALAFDLKLGRSVRFLGPVDDIPGLCSAIDVGVHSSPSEGCPNAVLECMAAGLPVIATDCPGIREAVGEEGYDLLAPPADPEALADRIVNMALSEKARHEKGAANRLRIENEFGAESMYQRVLSLITPALQAT